MEATIHLACQGEEDRSILSVVGSTWDRIDEVFVHPLLQYFTTKEATILRSVCSEFKYAVEITSWDDSTTIIRKNMHDWKISFPHAITVRIDAHSVLLDEKLFDGIKHIHILNAHSVPTYLLNIINLQILQCNKIRCDFQLFIQNG
jgi:hypothetical protein